MVWLTGCESNTSFCCYTDEDGDIKCSLECEIPEKVIEIVPMERKDPEDGHDERSSDVHRAGYESVSILDAVLLRERDGGTQDACVRM